MLKKMIKKISSGITAALMCLSMVSALPAAVINVSAETNLDLGAPAHEKTLRPNGDGTYNLSLSVKGESKASSEKTTADVVIIFDRSGSMGKNSGNGGTRLSVAQNAVNSLVDSLLKNEEVQVSLISFAKYATKECDFTNTASDIKNKVKKLKAEGGTNWEAALKVASGMTSSATEKYIIFVSDGEPTYRNTEHESVRDEKKNPYGYGGEETYTENHPEGLNYYAAKVVSTELVKSGYQLYTVNAYEGAEKMEKLVNDSYTGAGKTAPTNHYFSASDQTALKTAFNNIVQEINHSATYQNVTIIDPLTPETGIIPEFTYKVTDKDGKIVNNGLVLTDGSNVTLPAASYNTSSRTVTWNLGGDYKLPDGYTFKVSFEVFPTQETADKIAGFKNGKTYNSDENPNIIIDNGNYKVYSNTTDAKVTYHVVKDNVAGEKLSTKYNRPTMDVDPVLVHLTKNWNDSLDTGVRPDSIAFDVKQDGTVIDTITLSKDNWTRDYYLAAGIVKANRTTIRTNGHLYTFEEKLSPEDSKKYEITSASTKPMYVDGKLKEAKSGSYEEFDSNHNVSVGTNTLKGRLEIKKEVEVANGSAPAPADTEFTINVTLNKNGEQIASKFNVYNENGERTVTGSTTNEGVKQITLKANESIVFDNLDTGTAYTVEEVNNPAGFTNRTINYSNNEDVKAITANHKDVVTVVNDYFSITANKVWSDSNNQDGKRTSVTFKLQSSTDGINWINVTDSERTIGTIDNLSTAWTGYPAKDSDGNVLTYQVVEEGIPSGYTSEISGSSGIYTITNTYTPEKINISGTKTWNDNNNQDGKRPESITVKVMDGDTVVAAKEVTAKNGWKYSFENLDKYRDGQEISYTVSEESVTGYSTSVNGYDITNSYTPETVTVSGSKSWYDNNNQDGMRPESITVRLLADGTEVATKTVTANDNWEYEFTDLPKYRSGSEWEEITYTVDEESVTGYEKTIDGYNISNAHTPATITVSGSKTWYDNNNQDGKRPASIIVNLSDGEKVVASKEVKSSDGWAYSFEDLPKYKNGTEITYTVSEENVPDGYTQTVGTRENGYVITNTHTPEKVSVSGSKTWNDNNNQDGIRPTKIIVNLLADGTKVDSKTVTADDNWTYSFANLDKYVNGHEIVYTVTEEAVEGYTTTVKGFDISNTHTPEIININGSKVWADDNNRDGLRPDSITVYLLADGTKVASKTVTADDNWTYTFANMPKKANGKDIVYTVTEETVTNYETSYDGYNITNTHTPANTSVTVNKTWNDADNQDGKRPTSIKVNLLANGNVVQTKEFGADLNGNWTYTFDNLLKYENGNEIVYTVTEEAVADYTTSYDGYNITNSYTPETTEISGTKTWDDANDQDGKRPESITVNLLKNGTKIASRTVTAKDNWKYDFGTLPVYENAQKIAYTVTEDTVEGYKSIVDGYNVTNSYAPEKTAVNVSKVWDDANNQDGLRGNVTVKLFADDVDTGKTVVLSEGSNWQGSFTDLNKYSNGNEINYTVEEVAMNGYTPVVTRIQNSNYFVITNIHTPATTEISGTKTWDDNNDQDGIRPTQVIIRLYADGAEKAVTEASEATNWTYLFKDLPKYNNGTEIVYTVSEDEVKNYVTETDGTNFINSHTPSKIEKISGTKTWNDADNQDGKRPESITVRLLADGETAYHYDGTEVAPVTVKADENGNWNFTFTDLPEYRDGAKIAYTVREDAVDGYDATYSDGLNITNIHTPDTYASIFGHKTWNDGNDVDGKRPESITVRLLADGEVVDMQTVTGPDWNFDFGERDKYKDGKLIDYTIAEDSVEGYTTEITGDIANGYTISNTHEPETIEKISGTKTWNDNNNQDNKRPESITVRLYADGTEVASATTDEFAGWYYEFTDLPKYSNGKEITYTVSEDTVEGYETAIDGFNITNTHEPEKTSVSVNKVWDDADNQDGVRPESITVHLYANEEQAVDAEGNPYIATVTAADDWKYTFSNLDKYRNGNPVRYTVAEEYVEGYEIGTVTGNAEEGYTITNKRTPEMINRISGTKTWDDNNNQDGKRPESITVRLLADGTEVATETVTAANDWNYEFTNLPKYRNGKEITYRVTEDEVDGYTSTVEGYNITNTHTPETVRINGQKVWNDNNNAGNTRPESITVQLYANGVQVAETTANKDLEWFFTFGELPVYANGEKITYIVTETPVEGYRSSVSGNEMTGFTVRNTLRPQTPETNDKEEPTIKPETPAPSKRRPQTPFTADTSNVALYGGLTLVALAAVLGILIRRREN